MISRMRAIGSAGTYPEQIERVKEELESADAVVIGAGAGLSASAGFVYNGDGSGRTFLILRQDTAFMICIPAVFTLTKRRKSIGPIGAGISLLTVIRMLRSMYMTTYSAL